MTWQPAPDVLRALERAGLPAPRPERVRSLGYSAKEVQAIERARRAADDPHGTQLRS